MGFCLFLKPFEGALTTCIEKNQADQLVGYALNENLFFMPSVRSLQFYAFFSFTLTSLQLYFAIIDSHPHATARASLQLLSSAALIPVAQLPTRETPSKRRLPILTSFFLSVALLIESILRTLTAIEILVYSLGRVVFQSHLLLIVVRLASSTICFIVSRKYVPPSFPPFIDRNRKRHFEITHVPSVGALKIHAYASSLAHLCDFIGVYSNSSATAAALDIVASMLSVSYILPFLSYVTDSLMHATPSEIVNTVSMKREQVLALEGVLSVRNVHIWQESAGLVVGTVSVEIDGRVSKWWIVEKVRAIYEDVSVDMTVQVESWRGEGMELEKGM